MVPRTRVLTLAHQLEDCVLLVLHNWGALLAEVVRGCRK